MMDGLLWHPNERRKRRHGYRHQLAKEAALGLLTAAPRPHRYPGTGRLARRLRSLLMAKSS